MLKLGNNSMYPISSPSIVSALQDRYIKVQVGSIPGLTLTIKDNDFDDLLRSSCDQHAEKIIALSKEANVLGHIYDALVGATGPLCDKMKLSHSDVEIDISDDVRDTLISLLNENIESDSDFDMFYDEDAYGGHLIDAAKALTKAYREEYDAIAKRKEKYSPSLPVNIKDGKLIISVDDTKNIAFGEEETTLFLEDFKAYINHVAPGHIQSLQKIIDRHKVKRGELHTSLMTVDVGAKDDALSLIKAWQEVKPYYY